MITAPPSAVHHHTPRLADSAPLLAPLPPQLKVWRAGQHLDLSVALAPAHQLVPVTSWDTKPTYFVWAGMVGCSQGLAVLCAA